MRRTTLGLTAVVLGTAVSATMLKAQQSPPNGRSGVADAPAGIPGMSASRGARYLLRNGWDYLKYQEYERALDFFREAEKRKNELNDAERQALVQGIDNARRGMREASDGSPRRSYAKSGTAARPGAFALSRPSTPAASASASVAAAPAPAPSPAPAPEPIQLTSGSVDDAASEESAPPPVPLELPPLPPGAPAAAPAPAPAPQPEQATLPPLPPGDNAAMPASANAPRGAEPPRTLTLETETAAPPPVPLSDPTAPPPALADPTAAGPATPRPAQTPAPARAMSMSPSPAPALAPAREPEPAPGSSLAVLPSTGGNPVDLDSVPLPPLSHDPTGGGVSPEAALGMPSTRPPAAPAPAPEAAAPPPAPAAPSEPPPALPGPVEPIPPSSVPPVIASPATPTPTPDPATPPQPTEPEPAPAPAPGEPSLPPLPTTAPGAGRMAPAEPPAPPAGDVGDNFLPVPRDTGPSILSPDLQREAERMAQRQEDEFRRNAPSGAVPGPITGSPSTPTTRLEISRAPSPTEARPIRAIPVPDEFVPLPKRDWEPNRKYWSAAAACHTPLYFQDAALERYGQSVEQALGPLGRCFSYPVDDPKQSIQRNQILTPFASIGLFAFQIGMLPWNLVMDPPWEAEYDLGYYRPGDRVPSDVIYFPVTGVGPPLHGKRY